MRSGIIVPLTLLSSAGASIVPYLRRSQPVVCGQDEVSEAQKELLESRLQTGTKPSYLNSRADEVIDVNVYQHVVAFNETLEGGYLSVSLYSNCNDSVDLANVPIRKTQCPRSFSCSKTPLHPSIST